MIFPVQSKAEQLEQKHITGIYTLKGDNFTPSHTKYTQYMKKNFEKHVKF